MPKEHGRWWVEKRPREKREIFGRGVSESVSTVAPASALHANRTRPTVLKAERQNEETAYANGRCACRKVGGAGENQDTKQYRRMH